MTEELLDVVDTQGRPFCLRPRAHCHGNTSLAHRSVHVFVRNRRGAIFLQRRSPHKQIQPNRWDTSVGGHLAAGESCAAAALRELAEELGVVAEHGELTRVHRYVWSSEMETEHVVTFCLNHEGPFHLHPEEIVAGRFWTMSELQATAGTGELTPNLEDELRRLAVLR